MNKVHPILPLTKVIPCAIDWQQKFIVCHLQSYMVIQNVDWLYVTRIALIPIIYSLPDFVSSYIKLGFLLISITNDYKCHQKEPWIK